MMILDEQTEKHIFTTKCLYFCFFVYLTLLYSLMSEEKRQKYFGLPLFEKIEIGGECLFDCYNL